MSKRTPKSPIPDLCPCGSARPFGDCCGPYLEGTALPQTAEQLMRSRYSAYSRGDADYLRASWHPATRHQDLDLAPELRWLGLKILATTAGGPDDEQGVVEFIARYRSGGRAGRLHERSRFKRYRGQWCYVDGDLLD